MDTQRVDNTGLKILRFFATGCGVGFVPFMPGTVGTVFAVLLYFCVVVINVNVFIRIAIIVLITLIGFWSSSVAEKYYGVKDPHLIIIDEIAATLVILEFIPLTFTTVFIAFALFRFYDMVKPFPANRLEDLNGGVGIMMDDLIAGIYTILTLKVVIWAGIPYY